MIAKSLEDSSDSAARSKIMRSIRTANTAPEQRVGLLLTELGYTYRQNDRTLPGSPDIVLTQGPVAIYVNGCFWHGHGRCKKGTTLPKTRREFWEQKIAATKRRDRNKTAQLSRQGWKVMTIWECECSSPTLTKRLIKFISSRVDRNGLYAD
jgi:DNA mismatch endonuclease (patch repair protein)